MTPWRTISNGSVDLTNAVSLPISGTSVVLDNKQGTTAKPLLVRSNGPLRSILLRNCGFVILKDLVIDSDVNDKLRFEGCHHLWIENCTIRGGGTGIAGSHKGSVRNSQIVIRKNVIGPLVPVRNPKNNEFMNCEGMYIEYTDGLFIAANRVMDVGWPPATMLNHGLYIHGTNDDCVIRLNFVSKCSAAGIQARAGGLVEQNLVEQCGIGITWALVNGGGEQKNGGCTGEVRHNIVRDNRKLNDGMPLGYGIQLGANIRKGEVHGNIVYGDNTRMGTPFALEDGEGTFANDQIGVDSLSVHDNFSNGYKTQTLHIEKGLVKGPAGTRGHVNDLKVFDNSGFTPEPLNLLSKSSNNKPAWALPPGMGGSDIKAELRLAGINVT